MGGTALKRKARRNKTKVKARNQTMKVQGFKPVIRMVDVEAIKEEFKKNPPAKSAKTKAETPKAEVEAVETQTPAKEKKAAPAKKTTKSEAKKPAAKKAEPKAETKAKKPAAKKAEPKAKKETKGDKA